MFKQLITKVRQKRNEENNIKLQKQFDNETEKFLKLRERLIKMALKLKDGKLIEEGKKQKVQSVEKQVVQEQPVPSDMGVSPQEVQQQYQQPIQPVEQQIQQPIQPVEQQIQQPQQPIQPVEQQIQQPQQPQPQNYDIDVQIIIAGSEALKVQVPNGSIEHFLTEIDNAIINNSTIRLGNIGINGRYIIQYNF